VNLLFFPFVLNFLVSIDMNHGRAKTDFDPARELTDSLDTLTFSVFDFSGLESAWFPGFWDFEYSLFSPFFLSCIIIAGSIGNCFAVAES